MASQKELLEIYNQWKDLTVLVDAAKIHTKGVSAAQHHALEDLSSHLASAEKKINSVKAMIQKDKEKAMKKREAENDEEKPKKKTKPIPVD